MTATDEPVEPPLNLHEFESAARALDHGARAVIVSNHGGRQLDEAVASLDAFPSVGAAVGGRAELLLDGGARRGTDFLKALALGARVVLIGSPTLWGLAVAGESGVRHVGELLHAELALDVMLCDLTSTDNVDRSLLVPALPVHRQRRSTSGLFQNRFHQLPRASAGALSSSRMMSPARMK